MGALLATFVAAVLGTASAQSNDPETNPEGYWNRGWNCGQAAESFSVTIQVDDAAAALLKIDALMVAAGAPSQLAAMTQYGHFQNGSAVRQAQYSLPLKAGEKTVKKVWDFGDLTNYSVGRHKTEDSVRGIDERIKLLEKELSTQEVERLPAARYFLKSRLAGLRQNRASCESGQDRSTVMVTIQEKQKPAKPR